MKPLAECRLYTFIDCRYLRGRDEVEVARALCDGGSDLVQLRAKERPLEEVRRMAERILPVTQAAGVWFVVNDYPSLAVAVGAPLCHLGQEDYFDAGAAARAALSGTRASLRFGLSTHDPAQAVRALEAGPAYVAVGPVFPTGTKPGRPAATLEYVRWAHRHVEIPWFAIGGIHLGNLEEVLAAGARRICVVSAILNESDLARACQAFCRRLTSAPA